MTQLKMYHDQWLLRAICSTSCGQSPHFQADRWRPVHDKTNQVMASAFLVRDNNSYALHETIASIGCRNSYLNIFFFRNGWTCISVCQILLVTSHGWINWIFLLLANSPICHLYPLSSETATPFMYSVLCRSAYSSSCVNTIAIFDSGTAWACFARLIWCRPPACSTPHHHPRLDAPWCGWRKRRWQFNFLVKETPMIVCT
jgi:hypothetical protein